MDKLFSPELWEQIEALGKTTAPVLILGESGTGKEVVAQALHQASGRTRFVAIDCGALTGSLAESELFGHTRGAFTGADRDKQGLIAAAEGGTAFFDEIGDLPLELQPKLLRVLQEKAYRPLGSTGYKKADFRVVAATHRDLARMIEAGTFREDLYYRLNVLQLRLLALRDRPEEIPALVDHFIGEYGNCDRIVGQAVFRALFEYAWPGNIRQLSNVVQGMLARSTEPIITLNDLPFEIASSETWASARQFAEWENAGGAAEGTLAEIERRAILARLARFKGDRTRTAEGLAISRTTLFRKLKEYGIQE